MSAVLCWLNIRGVRIGGLLLPFRDWGLTHKGGERYRHLIADHLGWFKFGTEDGKNPTIEGILREKGEQVRRGSLGASGVVEYYG